MNIDSNFVLPDFVERADVSDFDPQAAGAFTVAGYRLDNPAGIWKAASDMLSGVEMSSSTANLIKQACSLFDITPDQFVRKEASTVPPLVITDGEHTASFNICDNESLNKAASEVLANRDNMSYAFAHDCAHTLTTIASYNQLSFDPEVDGAIHKLAGAAAVDYDKLKSVVETRAARAEHIGKTDEAQAFRKLANQCTSACPVELVPNILDVVDRFDAAYTELNKKASAVSEKLEQVVFMTNGERLAKRANEALSIDGFTSVTRGQIERSVGTGALYKWAADNGYAIVANSDAEAVVSLVQHMPKALRQEFISIVTR